MNQCIIKRIIFYHPIQNLLVHCRFTEFIHSFFPFFFYTLACQIFEYDCTGLLKNHEIFRLLYLCFSPWKEIWMIMTGVFYMLPVRLDLSWRTLWTPCIIIYMYNIAVYYFVLIKFEYWRLWSKFLTKFLT